MRKILLFSLCVVSLFGADMPQKKKILVLMSKGGRGHESAAQALEGYLKDDYAVKYVNFLGDVLSDIDLIKKISIFDENFGYEELYNQLLRGNHHTIIGFLNAISQPFLTLQNIEAFRIIEAYMKAEKPDLVISVEPLYNAITAQIVQKLGIPFWIIPTDFDANLFAQGLVVIDAPGCYFNIPLEDPLVMSKILNNISKSILTTSIGMPVRPQFLKKYNRDALKETLGIALDEMVIMVMLGGRGSTEMIDFAQELAKVKGNVHFIFAIGSADIKSAMEEIKEKNKMSATILGFTDTIAPYMACCDLLITKSGGQTVAEALYMQLPMMLDTRAKALPWEELNRTIVINKKLGTAVSELKNYVSAVQEIVNKPDKLNVWKKNIKELELGNPAWEVKNILKTIFGTAQQ